TPEGKKPLFFRMKDRDLMVLAGIWDVWPGPTEKLFTCAIVTTAANSIVEPVHDRMPVIMPPESWDAWLNPNESEPSKLQPLLQSFPADHMESIPVSPVVNNSRHEGPDCLAVAS